MVRVLPEDSPTGNSPQRRPSHSAQGYPLSFTPQRIHLHRDHELFEDGDVLRHIYLQEPQVSAPDDGRTLRFPEFSCHVSGCAAALLTSEEYEHHYDSSHRHTCCSCRSCLPSARLLDIHIQESHDPLFTILAQKQHMYQCLVEGCGQKFQTGKHRKDHLITIHAYPPDFRFDKPKKDRREKKRPQQKDAAMEVVDEACESESEGVGEVVSDVLSGQTELEESMEIRGSEEECIRIAESAAAHSAGSASAEPQKAHYSYRVPATICFGHGSVRGFRGRRGRRK
ncbi:zinc finger protein 511 [Brachionichthys hirsutus]|uniref:zinc finger protein 511 n=1 Tax=Brachionichthys hirsutus TaxID=412623 RepID=UPI0036046A8B